MGISGSRRIYSLLGLVALMALAIAASLGLMTAESSANANGTISLDKAWYSDSSVVTVTVQDSDLDTSTAADTAVTFDNDGGA